MFFETKECYTVMRGAIKNAYNLIICNLQLYKNNLQLKSYLTKNNSEINMGYWSGLPTYPT